MKHHTEDPVTPRQHRAALKAEFQNATPAQKREAAAERLTRAERWADYARPKFAEAARLGQQSHAMWEPIHPRLQALSFLKKDENETVKAASHIGRRGHAIQAEAQFFRHCADALQSDADWLNRSADRQETVAKLKQFLHLG